MTARLRHISLVVLAGALVALVALGATARAADLSQPMMLVAKPELGEFYARTILFARALPNGQHVGFIINRPTQVTLGKLFPDHAPSQKVVDPVFLGGPVYTNRVFFNTSISTACLPQSRSNSDTCCSRSFSRFDAPLVNAWRNPSLA